MRNYKFLFSIIIGVLLTISSFGQSKNNLFPNYKGWTLNTDFQIYNPNDLWDYINGGAENFVIYDFVELHIGEYTKGKESIKVELYRHSNFDNAFGIYSSERYADYTFGDYGTQGYRQADILNFLHRDFYIKMYASSQSKKVINAMIDIAGLVQNSLGEKVAFPEMLNRFPKENRLENAEVYIAKSFMGHNFLNKVFVVKYKDGNKSYELFSLKKDSAQECQKFLNEYMAFTSDNLDTSKEGEFLFKDPYNGDVLILWKGNVLAGARNFEDLEMVRGMIENLL
jgi:Family of unknown function (DUF6599)